MAPFSFTIDNALVYFIDTSISSETVCVSKSGYRYGFNGKESLIEMNLDRNNYDLGSRIFNSSISFYLSRDPRSNEYPWQSPYVYYFNSPISKIDFNGEGDGDRRTTTVSQRFEYDKTSSGAKLTVGTDFFVETVNQITYQVLDDGTIVETITTIVTTVMVNSKGEIVKDNVKVDYYTKTNHFKNGKYIKTINYNYHFKTNYQYGASSNLKQHVEATAKEKKATGTSPIQKKAAGHTKMVNGVTGGVFAYLSVGVSKTTSVIVGAVSGASGFPGITVSPEIYTLILSRKDEKL
jgi:RHS repeat-associated protein